MKRTKNLRLTAIILFCVLLLGAFLGCAQRTDDPSSTTPASTTEPNENVRREYYEDGTLKSEMFYNEDGAIEKTVDYYENGNKKRESTLVDGKDNIVLYYSEDGKLTHRDEHYGNDKNDCKERTIYREDGKMSEWYSFYEPKDGGWIKEIKRYYVGTEQLYHHATFYPVYDDGEGEKCKSDIRYNEDGSIQFHEEYDEDGNVTYSYGKIS